MTFIPPKTDVLIVGMGPVGAALANLLGIYGVNALVIDKALDIFQAPRAIALDNEALRVLQMCGLQEGDIDTVAIPEVRMHSPHFGQYGRAVTTGSIDGHPKLVTFYQPQLERVLRQRLGTYAGIKQALGCELLGYVDTGEAVKATLRDAQGQENVIEASYLVGADGANSLVRRLLGQEFQGKTYAEDWLVVDALKVAKPMDHVEFICDHARPTPHMVAPGDRQRWEFKLQPGETREQMERPETVKRLLAPWAEGKEIEIERVAVYRFHARLADKFSVGRVFLVGDAAHITPPFVGQGLVAGLRDIANLGWKLAWVVQGRASEKVLATYGQERRPHVRAMIQLARVMGRLVMPTNQVMAFVTHGVMKGLATIPRLRRLFENLEIKPANCFKDGCFTKGSTPWKLVRGGQFPQAWVRSHDGRALALSDDAIGSGFALVGFGVDPRAAVHAHLADAWLALGGQFVRVDPRGTSVAPSSVRSWEDIGGVLMPGAVPLGWMAVVRPDKTVMHDGPSTKASQMLEACLDLVANSDAHRHAGRADGHVGLVA